LEKIPYLNQPNCYRLSNDSVELIVTTDIGPRILRYAFRGEENVLGEVPDTIITTELGDWRPWAGHRLWVAPEDKPRSYAPDNSSLQFDIINDRSIRLKQAAHPVTQIEKEMMVSVAESGTEVTILHSLRNKTSHPLELAAWGITIMNSGGEAILPQEPYRSWNEYLLPARAMVLWHYTDLSDPRWSFGKDVVVLKTDANLPEPQKIGITNKQEWAGYLRDGTLFIKRFGYLADRQYPDFGCNNEVYTAGPFIEVESLGPLSDVAPGEAIEHIEHWQLFQGVVSEQVGPQLWSQKKNN
jgi:hypothetical protein